MKSLLILYSYHHKNTEKVAKVIAEVLDAQIKTPQQTKPEVVQEYDLVGFGSGIYGANLHNELLNLADKLPNVNNKKAFIFSTSALTNKKKVVKDHSLLKEKLQSKGYQILEDFQCKGFNTNSFIKYFGGINKGRPNAEDLECAKGFAANLKESLT
jgi:flavodoxin